VDRVLAFRVRVELPNGSRRRLDRIGGADDRAELGHSVRALEGHRQAGPAGHELDQVLVERTILVNSLSKTYAMTGWRVGYLAAPQAVIENALKAGQNSITCVAPFVQKAAAFALTDPSVQQAALEMRHAYARRRELVLRIAHELESERVLVTPPQGAFYFFLDFRPLKLTSLEICERLLEEAGVGLVPGTGFGAQGEGFVRMTIAASDEDVEAGFRKIVEWAERQ